MDAGASGAEAGAGGPANPPPIAAAAAEPAAANAAAAVTDHLRTLLTSPPPDLRRQHGPSGVLGLLSTPASHFTAAVTALDGGGGGPNGAAPPSDAEGTATEEECLMYLQAVAANVGCVVECIGGSLGQSVAEVARAAGNASTRCRNRSDIAKSGIIPALASIASAFQAPPLSSDVVAAAAAAESGVGGPMDGMMGGATTTGTTASPCCPVLTPAHPELLQCCLLSGHYRAASRLIASIPVRMVSYKAPKIDSIGSGGGNNSAAPAAAAAVSAAAAAGIDAAGSGGYSKGTILPGVTSETYLRYHYYLGMMYIGLDDLTAALSAFAVCLTVPCHVISAVTIAARKKMLLCRCLASDSGGGGAAGTANAAGPSDAGRVARRQLLLSVPAAASQAVTRYLGAASPSFISSSSAAAGGGSGSSSAKRTRGSGGMDDDGGGGAPMQVSMMSAVEVGVGGRRVSATSGMGDAGEQPAGPAGAGAGAGPAAPGGVPGAAPGAAGAAGPTRRDRERNYYNLGLYDQLIDAFATSDVAAFYAARETMAEVLAMDGNAGLAMRAEAELRVGTKVRAVSAVYDVCSLQTLATELGMKGRADEAERVVVGMVSDSIIRLRRRRQSPSSVPFSARIDQESGMVYFNCDDDDDDDDDDEHEDLSSQMARAGLAQHMGRCVELADRIRDLDASITATSRYQSIVLKAEASAKAASGGGGSGAGGGGPRGVAELEPPIREYD